MQRGFLSKTKADAGYPMVELDSESDVEDSLSSDDEINAFLNGSLKQKQHVHHQQQSSSEDEFEKEMALELDQRMANIEGLHKGTKKKMKIPHMEKKKDTNQKRYEDEFLDSIDKSDDEDSAGIVNQVPMSNDDLLYDPDMDDEDQKWVDEQRQKCQLKPSKNASKSASKKAKNSSSDSTLSCPACMSFLCRDCQRHSIYKSQFRAMFVTNCIIDDTERLRYPKEGQKNKKNKNKKQKTENSSDEAGKASSSSFHPGDDNDVDDTYHPVRCSVCTTEVGVYDKDEVYHFFNVIESNG